VKKFVQAQYSEDSDAVQALGLKKKSDYRLSLRKKSSAKAVFYSCLSNPDLKRPGFLIYGNFQRNRKDES